MIFKKLYLNIWIRVVGLLLNCLLFAYCFFTLKDILILVNLALALVLQVHFFVKSINRLNLDLENFFNAARNNDSTIVFGRSSENGPYKKLYSQFDAINKDIQSMKIELENKNQYFKVLVEHVGIGVLSFNESGRITLCNAAAKELFRRKSLSNLKDLDRVHHGLSYTLKDLNPNEQKLITLYRDNELVQLSVKATELVLREEKIKLVSLQNIKNELDERELDSWQKLIRILTHEIMNSVGPINSTISTLTEFLTCDDSQEAKGVEQINEEIIEDTVVGLNIIEERSQGMLDFVTRFRDLTLLPKPHYSEIPLKELFGSIRLLMGELLHTESVSLDIWLSPKNLYLHADKTMVEQILINLLRNSLQALGKQNDGCIKLVGCHDSQKGVCIEVIDNGPGIPREIQDKIFIPFFTTRRDGSGIGLSLSRQMMRLHKGTLTVKSQLAVETVFSMNFPDVTAGEKVKNMNSTN